MKKFYPIKVIDLRHQVDHITPEKFHLLEEYRSDTNNARLFVIFTRQREFMVISGKIKTTEIN